MTERAPLTEAEKAELLELIGDPDEAARELEEFSGFVRTFETNRDRFLREHPNRWVAVCRDGTLVAETQTELLAELDRRGARGHACIEFMDTQPRILVL